MRKPVTKTLRPPPIGYRHRVSVAGVLSVGFAPAGTPQQGFNLSGAAEWDRYRTQFREPAKQAAE